MHPISTNGGTRPLWAPDGSELFYQDEGRLFAVPVQTDPTFVRETPTLVIDGDYVLSGPGELGRMYDIDPTGERFLMIKDEGTADGDIPSLSSLTVVLNWHQELLERVPVP